jgi:hypothetical protein
VPTPTEGLGGAALVGRVLQMVSKLTLAVVCTCQCASIGRMTRVGLIWDTRHAWHKGQHWTYDHALRGNIPRHLLRSVCGHMHVCVGLGWDARHDVWVGTRRVSWTDEDIMFFEGVNVTPGPISMAHEWPMSAGARVVPQC